jgi:hypothetical protein
MVRNQNDIGRGDRQEYSREMVQIFVRRMTECLTGGYTAGVPYGSRISVNEKMNTMSGNFSMNNNFRSFF